MWRSSSPSVWLPRLQRRCEIMKGRHKRSWISGCSSVRPHLRPQIKLKLSHRVRSAAAQQPHPSLPPSLPLNHHSESLLCPSCQSTSTEPACSEHASLTSLPNTCINRPRNNIQPHFFFFDDCHTRAMLGPSHRERHAPSFLTLVDVFAFSRSLSLPTT